MTISRFHKLYGQEICPSCMESSLSKKYILGGEVLFCKNCGGVPAICDKELCGVIYMSKDIRFCNICRSTNPDSQTHSIFWGPI